ncbi:MAG: hypothetical protein HRT63_12520 [Erythrobacter sp.]|nr:hypothetical protein [Erythrobacter sp.]
MTSPLAHRFLWASEFLPNRSRANRAPITLLALRPMGGPQLFVLALGGDSP